MRQDMLHHNLCVSGLWLHSLFFRPDFLAPVTAPPRPTDPHVISLLPKHISHHLTSESPHELTPDYSFSLLKAYVTLRGAQSLHLNGGRRGVTSTRSSDLLGPLCYKHHSKPFLCECAATCLNPSHTSEVRFGLTTFACWRVPFLP